MPQGDQSVRPSVHPRSLVRSISSIPLTQSGSNLTHRVLLGKECAVISWMKFLGQGSRSYQTLQKSFVQSIHVYTFHLALFASYIMLFSKGCVVTLNHFSRLNDKVIAEIIKNPSFDHIFSPFAPVWLVLHPHGVFDQRVCSDLE